MKKKRITEQMRYRQSIIKYVKKYGVSHAAWVYKINRTNIYRWKNRYNGTLESLRNFPTIPKSHPKQHTQNEIKLIKDMFRKNKDTGLVTFWLKIKTRGYTRSCSSLYWQLRKLNLILEKKKSQKKKTKPYIQMTFPGERVQIDVNYPVTRFRGFNKESQDTKNFHPIYKASHIYLYPDFLHIPV